MSQDNKYQVTWKEVYERIDILPDGKIYGVPRGGAIAAGISRRAVSRIEDCDYILDDIIDSGHTQAKHEVYNRPFYALYDKRMEDKIKSKWLVFPWEHEGPKDIQGTVIRQLEYIGEDASRDGLADTPKRVIKTYSEIYKGYGENPCDILSTRFEADYDEMIILRDIQFYSTCEHHMLPFYGKIHIAYIPKGKVAGISKLARLVDCFSRRLQIQERMTKQIGQALLNELKPIGIGVVANGIHLCMMLRGVRKEQATMVTSYVNGAIKEKPEAREEFLRLIE